MSEYSLIKLRWKMWWFCYNPTWLNKSSFISANKLIDNSIEDMLQHQYHSDSVVAEIRHSSGEPVLFRMADIPVIEKLEKFIEDVRYVSG